MELKQFIKQTLVDIIDGISEAQNEINNGIIIPSVNEESFSNVETGFTSYQKIGFEVSVNVVESQGGEAKLSVVAAVIGGHMKGDISNVFGHTAKLNFSVPVKFENNKK